MAVAVVQPTPQRVVSGEQEMHCPSVSAIPIIEDADRNPQPLLVVAEKKEPRVTSSLPPFPALVKRRHLECAPFAQAIEGENWRELSPLGVGPCVSVYTLAGPIGATWTDG